MRPLENIEIFLLGGNQFRAVDFGERFALFHVFARVINAKIFDPALDLGVDRGDLSFVILNAAHGPDGFVELFLHDSGGFYPDEPLSCLGNLNGWRFFLRSGNGLSIA